ncbi:type I polyketide synthase [Cognatishimia activa]|uniref:Erythronolide synthase, modules 3 and 4 n=1 Tax=Cognatishimia activa TaxID=1715691 RepID=A0A0P1IVP6_9RHOB|nr:type I polyketide synthase [Cognatishimia activa]CUJ17446.1 Erythronolide synthase, modules 3 and 4 [Cognatishimia activa]CUK27561.1 Erythronolide synthase, modules 3 and 4 [Cognatishimia activa]
MTKQIFITGQACRLPGAGSAIEFKDLLQDGRCAVSSIPLNRWQHDLFYHPTPGTKGKSYTFAAGVLNDIWGFDLSVFNISPREANQMDPQQRILLQVVWEALEDAHLKPQDLAGQEVGVFVGASSMDHATILGKDAALADSYLMTGNTLSLVSNRISHAFDLRGPSFTVDTACSSAMVALDQARQALEEGRVDTAIVAGVNILLNPGSFVGFSAARMLSETGLCQSFSANADGYVRGEGCVAIVLQRDSKAPARARAKFIGSDTNADGFTMNVALPSEEGQRALLTGLYESLEVSPNDLSFIEAHGTGTLVGDPIEARALGRALAVHRDAPLPIGSAKSNVGHLEPASGLVGVLKTLIAFEDKRLPPSLHADELNPHINFEEENLILAREGVEFEASEKLTAGVSSFGFGGVNGHCVLETVTLEPAAPAIAPNAPERIFVTSSFCEASLREQAEIFAEDMAPADLEPGGLPDQLWHGRGFYPKRLGVLAGSASTASEALSAFARGEKDPRVVTAESKVRNEPTVFAYSGNGAQYAGMSLQAFRKDAAFREMYLKIDQEFQSHTGWSLVEKLEGGLVAEDFDDCLVAQSLLFADQAAQTHALASRGIKPAAVVGHSAGEVAAAWACGALDLAQAVSLVVSRSKPQSRLVNKGTMAAFQTDADNALSLLDAYHAENADYEWPVEIAAINSPVSVTLVGPKDQLTAFSKWVKRAHRLACIILPINYPYHSAQLEPYEQELHEALDGLQVKSTDIPFFSSTEGCLVKWDLLTIDYWWRNIRQPVQFGAAVDAALVAGFKSVLEVGAQPVLANYITATAQKNAVADVSVGHTLAKSDPENVNPMSRAALFAVLKGCAHEEGAFFSEAAPSTAQLPHYPWQNTEIKSVDSEAITEGLGTDADYHPLLGRPTGTGATVWRRDTDDQIFPALKDHQVGDASIMPGMALAEMAYAAAAKVAEGKPVEIRNLDLVGPVVLSGTAGVDIKTKVTPETGAIAVQSRARLSQDMFRDNLRASYSILSEPATILGQTAPSLISEEEDRGRWTYANARRIGLNYGPKFQGLQRLRINGDVFEVSLKEGVGLGASGQLQGFDPVQADCLLHALIAGFVNSTFDLAGLALLPVRIERLQVLQKAAPLATGRLIVRRRGNQSILVDVFGFDPDGQPALFMKGLRLQAVSLVPQIDFDDHAYHFAAVPCLPVTDIPSVDASHAQRAFESAMTAANAEDDTLLLLNAATHQALWSGFDSAVKADRKYEPREAFEKAETLWLEMLGSMGLAHKDAENGGWLIAEACDLPDAATIGLALLDEKPDLVSELSALLRLPGAVHEYLSEAAPEKDAASQLFGHHVANTLTTVPQPALSLVTALTKEVLRTYPESARLRVAAAGNGLKVFADLSDAYDGLKTFELLSEAEEAAGLEGVYKIKADEAQALECVVLADPGRLMEDASAAHLTSCLRPGGHLIVQCSAVPALNAAISALSPDGTTQEVAPDQLRRTLDRLGFETITQLDIPDGYGQGELFLCAKRVSILSDDTKTEDTQLPSSWEDIWFARYGQVVRKSGVLDTVTPADEKAPVLVLCNRNEEDRAISDRLLCLRDIAVQCVEAKRGLVAVVPNGAQYGEGSAAQPAQHALWAMLRTIGNEFAQIRIQAIDIAQVEPLEWSEQSEIIVNTLDALPDESEIVLTPNGPLALRVRQGLPQLEDGQNISALPEGASLERSVSGGLAKLEWTSKTRRDLEPTEVEIEVAATGLNYRDVMWAMGLLPEEALETGFAGPTLGLECSGHVSRVGSQVADVSVGDAVLAFGPACFSSHLISDQSWVTKLPEDLPVDDAAALPVAYFTAHYALETLGQLQPEDTVLIHGGAGGVGLAAIAVAQKIGATVIATAGSPVKQQFLRELGVEHVLSSRDTTFVREIRRLTDSRGVDVVLNSLAGQAMSDSLELLRPYGRFLELGKQDYYANTHVGLRALKNNISYFGIDVDSFLADRPDMARRVFKDVMDAMSSGEYPPLPYTKFGADQTVEAFRLMQRSGHIGKIVVAPQSQVSDTNPLSGADAFSADPEGWHVVAGGLGGLGLEVADWLYTRGARRIALLSRSGKTTPELEPRFDLLRKSGVELEILACDITAQTQVQQTFDRLRQKAPLATVFHSAMVLEDQPLAQISAESLDRTLPVKTVGLENLDIETRKDDLQAFIAFTSLATMIGNHGQAAYVAANAYQEALIKNRHALGLPALAVGWGAITDAGYVTRDENLGRMLAQMSGNVPFTTAAALNALGRLSMSSVPGACLTITPMKWGPSLAALKILHRPSHERLKQLAESSGKGRDAGDLRAELQSLPFAKAMKKAVAFLRAEVAGILRVPDSKLSASRPLSEYGMDSLMGVEMGLAAQEALGDDLPVPVLADDVSIENIAEMFVKHIQSGGSDDSEDGQDSESRKITQNWERQHMNTPNPATTQ